MAVLNACPPRLDATRTGTGRYPLPTHMSQSSRSHRRGGGTHGARRPARAAKLGEAQRSRAPARVGAGPCPRRRLRSRSPAFAAPTATTTAPWEPEPSSGFERHSARASATWSTSTVAGRAPCAHQLPPGSRWYAHGSQHGASVLWVSRGGPVNATPCRRAKKSSLRSRSACVGATRWTLHPQ
jgi:hypothetical protein